MASTTVARVSFQSLPSTIFQLSPDEIFLSSDVVTIVERFYQMVVPKLALEMTQNRFWPDKDGFRLSVEWIL